METRNSIPLKPLMIAGTGGFVLSLTLHLLTLIGVQFPVWVIYALLGGIFVMFFPLLLAMRQDPNFHRTTPFGGLVSFGGGLFSGTALWRKMLYYALVFYLMIQAGAATFADTSAGMASLPVQRVMTAMGMYFFYAMRLILYSQYKRIESTPTETI